MGKNFTVNGTIIQVKPLGEKNFRIVILSKEKGMLDAALYGGPKSRLKSLVSNWNTGIIYLSEGNNGMLPKINDFDVKKYHETFREDIYKMWAACLAAEVSMKTKCADNNEECWILFSGFIDGLELCKTKDACEAGLIRFLWRYLFLLGIQPDPSTCGKCGESFFAGNLSPDKVSCAEGGVTYLGEDNCFACRNCEEKNTRFFLGFDAVRYLCAASSLSPSKARSVPLSHTGAGQLKELVFHLIQNACDSTLKSLESGNGIL